MESESKLRFERFPHVAANDHARTWLTWQANRGLARNTVEAYGRGLEKYLIFLSNRAVRVEAATRFDVASYVRELLRPKSNGEEPGRASKNAPVANATLQQFVTVIRLFYDYLVEETIRDRNPVRQGLAATPRLANHDLIPRYHKLPWIPTEGEWLSVLDAARSEPIRNRLMLALSYDCALRREELCGLQTEDIDPSYRLIRIRAENTKGRRERVVPYSEPTGELFARYLGRRRQITRERGSLFLSESRRNRGRPVSIWTWSKVVAGLRDRSEVRCFTTHTPRHLCLTDLARADWDIHEIAAFAGHRSVQTTLLYIHLSGRDLAAKLGSGMAEIHARRTRLTAGRLS